MYTVSLVALSIRRLSDLWMMWPWLGRIQWHYNLGVMGVTPPQRKASRKSGEKSTNCFLGGGVGMGFMFYCLVFFFLWNGEDFIQDRQVSLDARNRMTVGIAEDIPR